MTNGEINEDPMFNELIENITKSETNEKSINMQFEVEAKKLKFKNIVYYAFILIGILTVVSAMTLTIGFIITVVPPNLQYPS
jgi:flavorubredoxin